MKLGSVSSILTFSGQALTGGNYYSSVEPLPPPPLGAANLSFHDDKSIKDFKGGVCVNAFLDEEEKALLNRQDIHSNEGGQIKDKFKHAWGEPKGCVAVSWDKETGSDGIGRGNIRYEWLFTVGGETIVAYGYYNPDEKLIMTSWRAIYINKQKKKSAGNIGFPKKEVMPKNPGFLKGKKIDYWGYKPIWGLSCKWKQKPCNTEPQKRTSDEIKLTWEAKEDGEHLFTDWTINFKDAFSYPLGHAAYQLTPLTNLMNQEGTGTER